MNPCTNGCQPPNLRAHFRCPDRLIPDRMSPSRRHRGSIHVVCSPPVRFSSQIVLPALYRHSRDGGNLAPCLPSFLLSTVILATAGIWHPACCLPALFTSFLLSTVIPATAGIWHPASDVYLLRRLQHGISIGAEPVAVRCGLTMAERTLSTILIRTTRRVWFCGGRIPRIGTDRDLRVFYA